MLFFERFSGWFIMHAGQNILGCVGRSMEYTPCIHIPCVQDIESKLMFDLGLLHFVGIICFLLFLVGCTLPVEWQNTISWDFSIKEGSKCMVIECLKLSMKNWENMSDFCRCKWGTYHTLTLEFSHLHSLG